MNNAPIQSGFDAMTLDSFSAALGVGAGFLLGAGLVALIMGVRLSSRSRELAALNARLDSERAALGDHFRTLAQATLQSNSEQFLTLAGEKLRAAQKDGEHDLQKRSLAIEQMVKPVEAHLQRMSGMVEQLQATDKTIRADLHNLHKETSKLTTALRNPAAQGRWGEFVLETILERANLIKGQHYETQVVVDGGRPDVIINLHDGFKIAIDSKAPINDFIARLDDDLSDSDFQSIKSGLARAVRGHVKSLGARGYQDNIGGADFVILFLPSEAVFSATLANDPTIVDYASENNVVIASPMLIISLLRVVGLSWRQAKMAENAGKVAELGVELHKRLCIFMDHFAGIGKNINLAMNAYNKAVGSFERQVSPQARKFKKYHVIAQNVELPDLAAYDNAPRQIVSLQNNDETDEDDEETVKLSHG